MKDDDRKSQFAHLHHAAAVSLGHSDKARLFRRHGAERLACEECGVPASKACHCGSAFCSQCPDTFDGHEKRPHVCGCGAVACFHCAVFGTNGICSDMWQFCGSCTLASCLSCSVWGSDEVDQYFMCQECEKIDCNSCGVEDADGQWFYDGGDNSEDLVQTCKDCFLRLEAERLEDERMERKRVKAEKEQGRKQRVQEEEIGKNSVPRKRLGPAVAAAVSNPARKSGKGRSSK